MQTDEITRPTVVGDVEAKLASSEQGAKVILTDQTKGTAPTDSLGASRPSNTTRAIVEWFWRGADLRVVRQYALPAWAACARFRRFARVTADLARKARDPLFEGDDADAVACELYRQSVYWSLRAIDKSFATKPSSALTNTNHSLSIPTDPDLTSLWQRVDRDLLTTACGAETVDWFERTILETSFVTFSKVAPAELARWATDLRAMSDCLIEYDERPHASLRKLLRQRVIRVGLFVAIPLMLWLAMTIRGRWNESDRDLARGKPWRASSFFVQGCVSPAQSCNQRERFFFHTSEEIQPWLEIDLGAPQDFSAVRVLNRTDCCRERAVPLVVEVSNDQTTWKLVGEQKADFISWKAKFPTVRARWVRLRATRRTVLHLDRVLVLP